MNFDQAPGSKPVSPENKVAAAGNFKTLADIQTAFPNAQFSLYNEGTYTQYTVDRCAGALAKIKGLINAEKFAQLRIIFRNMGDGVKVESNGEIIVGMGVQEDDIVKQVIEKADEAIKVKEISGQQVEIENRNSDLFRDFVNTYEKNGSTINLGIMKEPGKFAERLGVLKEIFEEIVASGEGDRLKQAYAISDCGKMGDTYGKMLDISQDRETIKKTALKGPREF
ncbi:MAG: hypothetical protein V4486_02180 [Patescibacteria group bacterium]